MHGGEGECIHFCVALQVISIASLLLHDSILDKTMQYYKSQRLSVYIVTETGAFPNIS